MTLRLRPALAVDAPSLSVLLGELGYPASPDAIPSRLAAVESLERAIALVAELDGKVVGLATAHVFPSIHDSDPVAWLTTLVVTESARGHGVGAALAAAIEDWARNQGAIRVSLTSGLHRESAHKMYEHLGYVQSGVRLTKSLSR